VATIDENIGAKDQKRRRTTIYFEKTGPDETFLELKKIGITPKDPSYFQFPIHIWNTTQIFFKTFKAGAFGEIDSENMSKSSMDINEKIVLVGAFDEFSFFAKPSIFDFFDKPTSDNFKQSYCPYHEYIANVLYMFESGDYIRYLEIPDLLFFFLVFAVIILSNLKVNTKLTIFACLLPFLVLVQAVIYVIFDTYINVTHSFALIIFVQIFFFPAMFIITLKNFEKAKAQKISHAKIQALESISEKLAHDIRSPLSTARLLLAKAKFETSEHKDMIINAIGRIDSMAEEILNKSKGQIVSVDIVEIIKNIVHEKQSLHPDISLKFNKPLPISYRIESSDLERIVSNLLDNSLSAVSPNKGIIEVSIKADSQSVIIKVKHNGIGIDKKSLAKAVALTRLSKH